MALRDVKNFQFLMDAIVQRFRNPNLKSFRGILYESQTNPHSIFGRTYTTFRELIGKGFNLHQYLNIGDRTVLENLYRNLKSDINLKFLNDPNSMLNDSRFALSDQYYAEQPTTAQAGQAPISPQSGVTGGGIPGMPSTPAISFTPRAPRIVFPKTTPAQGGMEGGQGQGTAATNKRIGPAPGQINQLNQVVTTNQGLKFQPGFSSTLKTFGSNAQIFTGRGLRKIGKGIFGAAKTGIESANPFLGRMGNGLVQGVSGIAKPGLGGGGGNIFGRFGRGGGIGGSGGFSIGKATKGRGGLLFILGLLGFMMLVGILAAIGGSTTPGEAAPITGSADLSTCLFTRSDQTPSTASYKSPTLLGYFLEASAKSGVPAPVLAGVARIESPGIVNYTDTTLASFPCPTSETGAKGLMQVQPPGTTGSSDTGIALGAQYLGIPIDQLNFCDLRQSIFLGAGVINTKAGGSWDPSKTNDSNYIDGVAEGYYGCLRYGAPSGSPCSDPRNIYSYGADLYAGVSQCKPTTGIIPPPPADGNYQKWPESIGIKMADGFPSEVYKWAYDILYQALAISPKFKDLIHQNGQCPTITLEPTTGISHAEGCIIPLSFGSGETFFKFLIIHELAHKINTTSWVYNSQIIEAQAADRPDDIKENNGFLTYYSGHAASDPDTICGPGDNTGNRADEDFAESMAYYINNQTKEQNMRNGECGTKWPDNPFQGGNRYKAHYYLINGILKSP